MTHGATRPDKRRERDPGARGRRIAIIGNMNNNGFALLRYFRDLGAEAWLLPFSTDGRGAIAHFAPEADSWEMDRWAPFIRTLGVPNSTEAIIGQPIRLRPPPAKGKIEAALEPYDRYIGSGVAPALFERLSRRLDIFFPYSMGIEFYAAGEFRRRMERSALRRLLHMRVKTLQARGIAHARYCLNAELSYTASAFEEIGKPFIRLGIPAVYKGRDPGSKALPAHLQDALACMAKADLNLFGSARQYWVYSGQVPRSEWAAWTKNNDWLFRGLAAFVQARPQAKPLLTLVAYGPDVEASKTLVAELGLGPFVQWLPIMPRREIMLLLAASDIGVGEFYVQPGVLWGGTGWEALASGRPLLQAFNFTEAGFTSEFGHKPPPILDAKSPEEITAQIARIHDAADKGRAIGETGAAWFDEHGGIGLARKWLALLDNGEGAAA